MPAPKQPRKAQSWHHARQSRHERGYGSDWVKLRKLIIARDGGLCQPCLSKGRPTPYAAVDHIVAKSKGGTDDPDNLQLICTACHDAKTLIDVHGVRRTVGADGWPLE